MGNIVSGDEKSLWADKWYTTQKQKRVARSMGIYYGILDKANRGNPLSNKNAISKNPV